MFLELETGLTAVLSVPDQNGPIAFLRTAHPNNGEQFTQHRSSLAPLAKCEADQTTIPLTIVLHTLQTRPTVNRE